MMRTSATVREFIAARGLRARVRAMPENTHTAEEAARALGTDLAHIAKSLLARLSDGRFILCILRGDQRLDRKKLCRAASAGCCAGAKHMSLAKADDVLRVTGYPVGAVPPFPLKSDLPAYIDPGVLEVDVVYCGGGDVDALLEVPTEELARITRAKPIDLALE